jgi:site-specific DNA-methyltransferase (adenine-specific)
VSVAPKGGARRGGVVLDPFVGAGTTAIAAQRLGRDYIGIELVPATADLARARIAADAPLFAAGGAA